MFSLAGLPERPGLGEGGARRALARRRRRRAPAASADAGRGAPGSLRRLLRRDDRPEPALALRSVWFEIEDGPSVLRGLDLRAATRASGWR